MDDQAFSALTEAAQAIDTQSDVAGALEEIVTQARRCLPEFEHVSVSMVETDKPMQTLAATDGIARALDDLQCRAGKGPCVEAIDDDEIVAVRNARHEQRWPEYISEAVALGLRSQLGVRIPGDPHTLLGLNLYSTSDDGIDPGSIGVAEHFAVHAGIALGRARQEEHLRTAIGTRTIIGAAIGILMERVGLTQQQAFGYLMRQSSTQNRKLRLVAAHIVAETESNSLRSGDISSDISGDLAATAE
jgi:GAF domain-containing protein